MYICLSMDSQLNGNFLPGSLPHKVTLFVTLIICFVVNKSLSLSPDKFSADIFLMAVKLPHISGFSRP